MLKQLGRLERTRNILILGFAILMAVSLIVFYAPGRSASSIDPSRNTEVVAKVGSNSITVADLARVKESYMQFGGQMMGFGNRTFLAGLINKYVILQEAERLGLAASNAEVADRIRADYKDSNGQFDLEKYKQAITARYGDIEKFENDTRASISQRKLQAFLSASVNVSDEEVEEEYKRRNTSFDVSYISLTADKLAAKIQPTEEEMRSYFESHKTDYRFHEPQKKVRYLFINTEKAGSKLQISDSDLKTEYDNLDPKYKEAGIRIQQILLKVARQDLDKQVEQKATDLIAKLRGPDGKGTEAAFAEAARGQSEDPATAKNNGFILRPYKRPTDPSKVHGLYDRMVDLEPGEIFNIPIRYQGHWYILRRGDSVPKTFAEAKPELLVSLRNRRGYGVAHQLAQKAHNRLKETKDLQKVAQEFAAEANMTPAEMVRETAYVKPGDEVPDIGVNQQFESALAALNNANDIGEVTGVKEGFAIPILIDKKEPRIPEFDEVRTKISDALKQQRAKEQLEQKAKDLIAGLGGPGDLKAAGEREGFDSGLEEGYKRESTLGKAGASEILDDVIYNLKEGEFTRTPVRVDDKWVIVGLVKRDDANMAGFAAERDRIKQTMLRNRQSQVFEDYIAGVQERMKRDGKITIYDDVLARLDAAEPAAQPLPGGLNFPNFPVK